MVCLTSCLKMKPEIPATSSARNTKVKNMAYWGKCIKKNSHTESHLKGLFQRAHCTFTDQFEHPWAAAARSEAAEQSENNDGGSGPDEDIWCIGALLRGQREIGLQAHLPPHPDSQQDHACELKKTTGRVSSRSEEPQRGAGCLSCLYKNNGSGLKTALSITHWSEKKSHSFSHLQYLVYALKKIQQKWGRSPLRAQIWEIKLKFSLTDFTKVPYR